MLLKSSVLFVLGPGSNCPLLLRVEYDCCWLSQAPNSVALIDI